MSIAVICTIIIVSRTIFAEGEFCKVPSTGAVGQCQLLTKCASALRALESGSIPGDSCEFQEGGPIVCCSEIAASTTRQTVKATPNTIYTTTRAAKPISQEKLHDRAKSRQGEFCKVPSTGAVGVCQLLTKCPSALRSLETGSIPEDSCGFQEGGPIVCCTEITSATRQTVKATPNIIYTTTPAAKPISQEKLQDGAKGRQGEFCKVPSTGAMGRCQLLTKCASALRALETGSIPGDSCGFQEGGPIVCCTEITSATRQTVKATPNTIYTTTPAAKPMSQRRGETCTTPNNEIAKCMPLESCTILVLAIQQNTTGIRKFAQQSQCGYDSMPLVCCGTASRITLLSRALPNRTVCGLDASSRISWRITNGDQTVLKEFPWMAALEYNYKVSRTTAGIKCGGSVINNRYVLTAAHCIETSRLELISVWLGDWKLSTNPDCEDYERGICSDPVEKFNIEEKIPHPHYNPVSTINDIALLRLARDITYTDYIIPICLPNPGSSIPNSFTRMTVAGWGLTENSTTSDIKLKVEIPLRSNKACMDKFNRSLTLSQLCAGGEVGKDSCKGDSGGPLMRFHKDFSSQVARWFLEGIVSWGGPCGDYPAVYTRVSQYVHWIVDTVSVPLLPMS